MILVKENLDSSVEVISIDSKNRTMDILVNFQLFPDHELYGPVQKTLTDRLTFGRILLG